MTRGAWRPGGSQEQERRRDAMKLARKISLAILAVTLLSSASTCLALYLLARRGIERQNADKLEAIAQSRADHIQTYLAMLQASLAQLSRSVALENLLQAPESPAGEAEIAHHLLRRTREANPAIDEFLLLNAAGQVVASSRPESGGEDLAADPLFLGGREGFYLQDIRLAGEARHPLLGAAIPLQDSRTGAPLGVVAARATLDQLNAICARRTGLGESGDLYLVDRDNLAITPTLFRKDAALRLRVDMASIRPARPHPGQARPPHAAAGVYPDYRGVPVLGTYAVIPETGWVLVAEIDTREAFAPLKAYLRLLILLLLALPIPAWLAGAAVARALTRRLTALHRGTEIIGAGNLDHKVGTSSLDEVGQLSRAFDRMTGHLKHSMISAQRLNNEIAERQRIEEKLRQAYTILERSPAVANAIAGVSVQAGSRPAAPGAGQAVSDAQAGEIFNTRAFASRLFEDRDLMREVIRLFLEETPKWLRDLDAAAAARRPDEAARQAHTLRGSAANVGAERMQEAAAQIERACRRAAWDETARRLPELHRAFADLQRAMQAQLRPEENA